MSVLVLLISLAGAQTVANMPRVGDNSLKFLAYPDNSCDEANINPCFGVLKPALFRVGFANGNVNGFATSFEERF